MVSEAAAYEQGDCKFALSVVAVPKGPADSKYRLAGVWCFGFAPLDSVSGPPPRAKLSLRVLGGGKFVSACPRGRVSRKAAASAAGFGLLRCHDPHVASSRPNSTCSAQRQQRQPERAVV